MSNKAFQAAEGNRVSYRYLLEDPNGFGVTPAVGKLRELRTTGNGISAKKETKTSEEIRADRMNPGLIETGASSDGEVKGELSFATYDDFLAAWLYTFWTRPMTGDTFGDGTVAITGANTLTIAGNDATAYFPAGRRWKLEGFETSANNRYVQVSAPAFDAGNNTTTVTVTANDLVAEATSDFARIVDANDVLVFGANDISASAAGFASAGNGFAKKTVCGKNQSDFVDRITAPQ